ncbi:MAG: DinB family protein [Flavobacteriales bacterium]|nr:DinB family protein [Flavobacteriales bacterium]
MPDQQRFVKMVLDAWHAQVNGTTALLDKLTDAQLKQEVATGRNRGTYLVGHLTAEHDLLFPLLRFGAPLFPELKPVFVDAADGPAVDAYDVAQLRARWTQVHTALNTHVMALAANDWFMRHNNIAETDFAREPHRNRLNVLITRTIHLAHHRGQLMLLSSK